MRLVVLGPPGAGKGTQASRLAKHLGIPHVATGDMFRKAHEKQTPLTQKVRSFMDRGELVPDELTNEMVRQRLNESDASDGFILDGYPRNFEQAKALDDILSGLGQKIDTVIRFMVTGDEIVARLSGRRVCPKCHTVYHVATNPPKKEGVCDKDGTPLIQREDDKEETVRRRLEVYGERTKPLYDFFGDRGVIVDIDAIGSSDEVFERLVEAVDSGGAQRTGRTHGTHGTHGTDEK